MKAFFDYNPDNDPYIPCKEAGLCFQKGDILHIVSQVCILSIFDPFSILKFYLNPQDDGFWWQARKEVDKTTRAGLIPSRALQERRIIHERTQMAREMSGSESKSEEFQTSFTSIFFLLSFILILILMLFPVTFS